MSDCLCETCPLGAPNLTYAAVHCLHRFNDWPSERSASNDHAIMFARSAETSWQASDTMPLLFTPLAA